MDKTHHRFDARDLYLGLVFLVIGLFKKSLSHMIAGPVIQYHNVESGLPILQAWTAMIGYSLQLYFDFSFEIFGHAGISAFSLAARLFVYFPWGNCHGTLHTYANLFLVFLIGRLWHRAGWTFLVWGVLHGAASVVHKVWQSAGKKCRPY